MDLHLNNWDRVGGEVGDEVGGTSVPEARRREQVVFQNLYTSLYTYND